MVNIIVLTLIQFAQSLFQEQTVVIFANGSDLRNKLNLEFK